MPDAALIPLATKMAASAAIVVLAAKAMERSGPLLGAIIATLPISAGPNYAFLAAEHGPAFLAESAGAGLAANAATIAFILVYALAAQRLGLAVSLGLAAAVWIAAAWWVARGTWSLGGAVAANVLAFAVALPVARRGVAEAAVALPRAGATDVLVRALGVMALVGAVLVVGRLFGPAVAGVAAVVPVTLTSLAVILHRRVGGRAAAAALAQTLPGMIGFAVSLLVLSLAAVPVGSAAALAIALGVCLVSSLGIGAVGLARARRRPPPR